MPRVCGCEQGLGLRVAVCGVSFRVDEGKTRERADADDVIGDKTRACIKTRAPQRPGLGVWV